MTRRAIVALGVLATLLLAIVLASVLWSGWIAVAAGAVIVVVALYAGGMRYGARLAKRSSARDDTR